MLVSKKKSRGSMERPRLSVSRSLKHISSQLIDDMRGVTLVSASTKEKKGSVTKDPKGGKRGVAAKIGKLLAERARAQGIEKVFFDRGEYRYHGRIKALADGAREGGLLF